MIPEPVFLRADKKQSGPVGKFQTFHRRIAAQLRRRFVCGLGVEGRGDARRTHRCRNGTDGIGRIDLLKAGVADPFGLYHLPKIIPEFVGIDMLQFVGLGDDAGIVVVADEMKDFCSLFHRHNKLRFHPRAVVAARIVEIGIARYHRNIRSRKHRRRKQHGRKNFFSHQNVPFFSDFSGVTMPVRNPCGSATGVRTAAETVRQT